MAMEKVGYGEQDHRTVSVSKSTSSQILIISSGIKQIYALSSRSLIDGKSPRNRLSKKYRARCAPLNDHVVLMHIVMFGGNQKFSLSGSRSPKHLRQFVTFL
jgi:hypothetical protein